MRKSYVYILYCKNKEGVYVGKSIDPRRRHREHLTEAKNPRIKRQFWVASIINSGFKLEIDIVEECTTDDVDFYESLYIALLKNLNIPLMNLTNGGDGIYGFSHTEETKRKIGIKSKGRKMSPEHNYYLHQVVARERKISMRERYRKSLGLIDNKYRLGKAPVNKGKRRLSVTQVEEIKARLVNGEMGRALAKIYSVPESTVSCIKNDRYLEIGWGYKSSANSWKNKHREGLQKNVVYLYS